MIALGLDRSSRIGLAMAGFLAPIALALVLRLAGEAGIVEEAIAPLRIVQKCDARQLDVACEGGAMCVAGVCRAGLSTPRITEGGSCANGELCDAGLECYGGFCRSRSNLPIADASCRRPEVREVIEMLKRYCADASGSDIAKVDLLTCDEKQWEAIARTNAAFDRPMLKIPSAFAVFFPTGEPRGRFPSPSQGAHYAARITEQEALVDALTRAKAVMVIGRASATGNEAENLELAWRRAKVAEGIVRDALGWRSVEHVRRWGLADEFALSIDVMSGFIDRPIAADAEEASALREQIRSWRDHEAGLRAGELLNQVALVIPFQCDGGEFFPPSAYYEPTPAR